MHIYRMLSMSDPDMPDTDEPVALAGPLKDKFLEAIRSEWENLRKKTLVPVSKQELELYVAKEYGLGAHSLLRRSGSYII